MILIIGIDGLLGNYLFKELKKNYDVLGTSRNLIGKNICNYDILNPISNLQIDWSKVEYVILAAASSNVGFCELEPNLSNEVNFIAPVKIIKELKEKNIPVITFSSEYVFNGKNGQYSEQSQKSPNTNYGLQKSKLEDFLIDFYEKTIIFRISKIASLSHKKSFFFKMLDEMLTNEIYSAATDQFFTPINIEDCGEVIFKAIKAKEYGLFNLCGVQNYSRYSLALALKDNFKINTKINKCSILDINLTYNVPPDLTMTCEKLKNRFKFMPKKLNFDKNKFKS